MGWAQGLTPLRLKGERGVRYRFVGRGGVEGALRWPGFLWVTLEGKGWGWREWWVSK